MQDTQLHTAKQSNLPVDTDRTMFHFSKAEPSDNLKIFKGLKSGTSVVIDGIPPKLEIISAEVIANPLTKFSKHHNAGGFNLSKC